MALLLAVTDDWRSRSCDSYCQVTMGAAMNWRRGQHPDRCLRRAMRQATWHPGLCIAVNPLPGYLRTQTTRPPAIRSLRKAARGREKGAARGRAGGRSRRLRGRGARRTLRRGRRVAALAADDHAGEPGLVADRPAPGRVEAQAAPVAGVRDEQAALGLVGLVDLHDVVRPHGVIAR